MDQQSLWDLLEENQTELETFFETAAAQKDLTAFGPMVPILRRMHWYASFQGLAAMANLCAGAAALASQLQESRFRWSVELTAALSVIISRQRDFLDAKPQAPSAGIFLDSRQSVIQGPELTRPVPVDDLLCMLRRRQIDVRGLTSCRELSIGKDPDFSHAVTIPSAASSRHKKGRYLTLVYLDLENQNPDAAGLAGIFEEGYRHDEILLHGPLAIPWEHYKAYRGKRSYYLLLDTAGEPGQWLKERDAAGRVIKQLKQPDEEEPRLIFREIPVNPLYNPSPHGPPHPARSLVLIPSGPNWRIWTENLLPGADGSPDAVSGIETCRYGFR